MPALALKMSDLNPAPLIPSIAPTQTNAPGGSVMTEVNTVLDKVLEVARTVERMKKAPAQIQNTVGVPQPQKPGEIQPMPIQTRTVTNTYIPPVTFNESGVKPFVAAFVKSLHADPSLADRKLSEIIMAHTLNPGLVESAFAPVLRENFHLLVTVGQAAPAPITPAPAPAIPANDAPATPSDGDTQTTPKVKP